MVLHYYQSSVAVLSISRSNVLGILGILKLMRISDFFLFSFLKDLSSNVQLFSDVKVDSV